ncbi:dihydroneopterin aldolase [Lentilactobacillus parakefiri]|uniref:7,8-dihydroneopterin aldolase n=1 Tax=Lentilactobacillus parakefiri TaxID=152332 RepID=A0A269YPN8_9LACO|nr:dihydroneopterin aldolase [Lentilactobacillus parakefiri]PAK87513.1 dihydroneopterin aldolase [Lentilactobacillus parakefiri]
MYKITMHNMRFHSHIGVLPEEKVVGQNIQIDLKVAVNAVPADDDLKSTVSYADFYPTVANVIQNNRVNLIETLAQIIIDAIKNIDRRIAAVNIHIRKQGTPINGVLDDVEIEMEH